MIVEKTDLYKNYSAWESDVANFLKIRIENGANPKEAYIQAIEQLGRTDLVRSLPQGVIGAGELINPYRKINNLMRELGYGIIVEGPRIR